MIINNSSWSLRSCILHQKSLLCVVDKVKACVYKSKNKCISAYENLPNTKNVLFIGAKSRHIHTR